MDPTPAAEFPHLVAALGLNTNRGQDAGEAIRPRLNEILKGIEAVEKEAKESLGPDEEPDQPFAKPARILLGLTARSEHKKIGKRREIARPVRGVETVRTMRNHQDKMARQFAAYLLSRVSVEIPQFVTYGNLYGRDISEWLPILNHLQRQDLRRITAELATSYRPFASAVADGQLGSRGDGQPDWRTFFLGLQMLGERGFKDQQGERHPELMMFDLTTARFPFFGTLSRRVLEEENVNETRFALVIALLDFILTCLLPYHSDADRQHLELAAQSAQGQQPVFLEMLEATADGRDILAEWCWLTTIRVDTEDAGISRHRAIHRGFEFIWQLLHPDKSRRLNRKALNRYFDTWGGTDPAYLYRDEIEIHRTNARVLNLQPPSVRAYIPDSLIQED